MDINDNIIPLSNYSDELITIHGIKFTHREIDVIACIYHTRGSSKIASLLSISSRTVETHTANIMRKMDTNSREGIIDFLEKHGHTLQTKKHYQALILQSNFKKRLHEVHQLIKDQYPTFCIVFDNNAGHVLSFLHTLTEHFGLSGIHIVVYERETERFHNGSDQYLPSLSSQQIVYLKNNQLNQPAKLSEIQKKEIISKLWPKTSNLSPNIINIYYDSRGPSTQDTTSANHVICFDSALKYYSSFFNLLKLLLPQANLSHIIASFEKYHESITGQLDQDTHLIEANVSSIPQQSSFSKRQFGNLLLISAIFMGTVYLGVYLINHYKFNATIKEDFKFNRAVRSDLIVPSEITFLNRPNILAKIEESLKGKDGIQTVAIVGIGGAGKSTIARTYALNQNCNVVWEVNATSRETLLASFERLAYALCRSEEEKKVVQVFQDIKNDVERSDKILMFVKGKLKSNSNWMLIFDNVEKFTSIRKYFPSDPTVWGNGKIIITTSNSNTKNNSLINNFIYIGELTPNEKLHLFTSIMFKKNEKLSPTQEAQAKEFLNDIPPFPLDVSIAAYYLKSTNTPYKNYLERLNENNKDFDTIQMDVVKEASGYTKTRYNIISLSLMQLINTHKDFKDLLLLISLLNYKNIPIALLSNYKGDTVVDNFIYNLKQYSLITTETVDNSLTTLSIHKTTQEIILAYLVKSQALSGDSPLIKSLTRVFENYAVEAVDNEDFSKMKLLVSHCDALLSHGYDLIIEPERSSIRGALGCIYYYLRHNIKAKELLENSLTNLQDYKQDHPDTIARLSVYLGNFYRSVGDYEKAKTLLTQGLTLYKTNPNYYIHIRALGYLGAVYQDLGEYRKSKDLLTKSLELYEKHPTNNISHAWLLAHLGKIYLVFGDYSQAQKLFEQSLAIYKQRSEDYVGVSWVLGYLGTLQMHIGNLEQSRNLLEQSLSITRKYFSDDHIFIAARQASLALVYIKKGDYLKGKALLYKSLRVHENNYGKDNIETARITLLLAEAYALEGDLDTAEDLMNKTLFVFQQKNYPEGYKSLEALADLYFKKASQAASEGDPKQEKEFKSKAIQYLKQCLDILQKCFDENSPHIIEIRNKLNSVKV